MLRKLKNQMELGGCLLLIFFFSLKRQLLAKFSLKIGKYIPFKANGPVKLMEDAVLCLARKEHKQNKALKVSIYNLKVTIAGLITLNSG